MLFDRDGEWDALLVERDLPVMDGFGIAEALRDFEKARRNRASTIRAAAVEEHGRAADKSRGHGIERDDGGETARPERLGLMGGLSPGGGNSECRGLPRRCSHVSWVALLTSLLAEQAGAFSQSVVATAYCAFLTKG